MLLTLASMGNEGLAVDVCGPSDLSVLARAMRVFVKSAFIRTTSFGAGRASTPGGLALQEGRTVQEGLTLAGGTNGLGGAYSAGGVLEPRGRVRVRGRAGVRFWSTRR